MRRTIRKTFLLEGETVTMKYVKKLCGEERYGRMIEDAKKKFFADPTIDLCYLTPAGYLTNLVPAGLTLWNRRRRAAFSVSARFVAAMFALCRAVRSRAAPCRFQIQPRRTAISRAGKPQGIIGLEALHGASGRDKLPSRF